MPSLQKGYIPEKVNHGNTTHSRHDAWTREKAEELQQQLRSQMSTKIPALSSALDAVADEFPEAFGEDISWSLKNKKKVISLDLECIIGDLLENHIVYI